MHIHLEHMYPHSNDHRCMKDCYTTEVSHIDECTYTKAPPASTDQRSMEYHCTEYVKHIADCTYT